MRVPVYLDVHQCVYVPRLISCTSVIIISISLCIKILCQPDKSVVPRKSMERTESLSTSSILETKVRGEDIHSLYYV